MKKRILWMALFVSAAFLLAACGPSGATPDPATGEILILQEDDEEGMNFSPETIVLTAGETVTIKLENHGSKDHEFMIGREVVYTDTGAPNGFEVDFFEGIEDQVEVSLGEGAMLMIDSETVAMGGMAMDEGEGEMAMEEDGEHEHEEEGEEHEEEGGGMEMHMDHSGWMVMDAAGSGQSTITFTVPEDRVGEWELACFEDDGTHYDDGMRGTLIVRAP
jgi:hypothetical protein